MKNKREEAIKWWNKLSISRRIAICNTSDKIIFKHRDFRTLSGREIELLYKEENDSDLEIINLVLKKQ